MISTASVEFSNLISCGFGSDSCCEIQNLIVVTSQENFRLVQELFNDLPNIFSAWACATSFSFVVVLDCWVFSFFLALLDCLSVLG